jgi:hypothetical protein
VFAPDPYHFTYTLLFTYGVKEAYLYTFELYNTAVFPKAGDAALQSP